MNLDTGRPCNKHEVSLHTDTASQALELFLVLCQLVNNPGQDNTRTKLSIITAATNTPAKTSTISTCTLQANYYTCFAIYLLLFL